MYIYVFVDDKEEAEIKFVQEFLISIEVSDLPPCNLKLRNKYP